VQSDLFGKPVKSVRKRASTPVYISPNQLTIDGFETPFEQKLTKKNRWVILSDKIPWDAIVNVYNNQFTSTEGRPPISGRVVIGAVIIKHMLDLTDRDTILHIQENVFMQYFLGYSTMTTEAPFSPTLFVEIRERLSVELLSKINQILLESNGVFSSEENAIAPDDTNDEGNKQNDDSGQDPNIENQGQLLMDATVAPQNITFPTDLKLLNSAREKSEYLIDKLYKHSNLKEKPRTYREIARKDFLNIQKKKLKSHKEIYKGIGSQLRYLKRNLGYIQSMIAQCGVEFLSTKNLTYIETLELVYAQQYEMHTMNLRSIENRIVNIHQPHVRPIVRGKEGKKVEFGSKLQVALVRGYTYIEKLSWDNFNEGKYLIQTVENYKKRMGHYPKEVLADSIYGTRENRQYLKDRNIKFSGKPLGRPSLKAVEDRISPGDRNPIEGKFGQAKQGYGMNLIRAKLKNTSESWIATIALVLNLVRLTRRALLYIYYMIRVLLGNKLLNPSF
jgi:transposase, IS5 family